MKICIGVDIGGTKTEIIALTERGGKELYRHRIPTPKPKDFLADLAQLIINTRTLMEKQKHKVCHIGIGVPGPVYPDKSTDIYANLTDIKDHFITSLEKLVEQPIDIENDANCFALSEHKDGAAKKYKTAFCVILGTGVGAGLIVNNKLVQGYNSLAGEWGNIPLPFCDDKEQENHTANRRHYGSIYANLQGPSLIAEYKALTGTKVKSVSEIEDLAEAGNKTAKRFLNTFYDRLARALLIPLVTIDPEIVVLGGGVSKLKGLTTKVPPLFRKYCKVLFGKSAKIRLRLAKHGDSSGVRGAAFLWKTRGGVD